MEEGQGRSWADALNRIMLTGEMLVVDASDVEEAGTPEERERRIKVIHAAVRTCAKRRALRVTRHYTPGRMLFRVVPE